MTEKKPDPKPAEKPAIPFGASITRLKAWPKKPEQPPADEAGERHDVDVIPDEAA